MGLVSNDGIVVGRTLENVLGKELFHAQLASILLNSKSTGREHPLGQI